MPNGLAFYGNDLDPENNLTFDDNTAINPFRVTVDGVVGGTIVKKIFLHNDHPNYYYTDIEVSVYDSSVGGEYTSGNWRWKLISSTREPVPEEWDQVESNNTLSIDDMGSSSRANTSDFIPIWIQCTVPEGMLAQNITDLSIRISARKGFVE